MILNRQDRLRVDVAGARAFAARLAAELKLETRDFNVCLVDDDAIRELNGAFRKKHYATDVLSFTWQAGEGGLSPAQNREFDAFLGDVVISVETAGRNARAEGHSRAAEIRWLILHGVLHLLGMDHETDHGEMEARELELRIRLGLNGSVAAKKTRRNEPRRGRQVSTPTRMLKSTPELRHSERSEESRSTKKARTRFLASLGMTKIRDSQHPPRRGAGSAPI